MPTTKKTGMAEPMAHQAESKRVAL
jgi:hypothetical protein